jgi:hypothetical protein
MLFPYDWRLSNVLSAIKLAETASGELDRWRKRTQNPDAKLVFICHSRTRRGVGKGRIFPSAPRTPRGGRQRVHPFDAWQSN